MFSPVPEGYRITEPQPSQTADSQANAWATRKKKAAELCSSLSFRYSMRMCIMALLATNDQSNDAAVLLLNQGERWTERLTLPLRRRVELATGELVREESLTGLCSVSKLDGLFN